MDGSNRFNAARGRFKHQSKPSHSTNKKDTAVIEMIETASTVDSYASQQEHGNSVGSAGRNYHEIQSGISPAAASFASSSCSSNSSRSKGDQKARMLKVLTNSKMKLQKRAAQRTSPRVTEMTTLQSREDPSSRRDPLTVKQSVHIEASRPFQVPTINTQRNFIPQDENSKPKGRAAARSIFARKSTGFRPSISTEEISPALPSHRDTILGTRTKSRVTFSAGVGKVPLAALADKDDYDDETESYGKFLGVLHNEVSGDHQLLRRSFKTLFSSKPVPATPMSREKRKKVKFDDNTRGKLKDMNLFLKRASKMECKTETQLVNDKAYAKEKKAKAAKSEQSPAPPAPRDPPKIKTAHKGTESNAKRSPRAFKRPQNHEVVTKSQQHRSDDSLAKEKEDTVAPLRPTALDVTAGGGGRKDAEYPTVGTPKSWLTAHREKQRTLAKSGTKLATMFSPVKNGQNFMERKKSHDPTTSVQVQSSRPPERQEKRKPWFSSKREKAAVSEDSIRHSLPDPPKRSLLDGHSTAPSLAGTKRSLDGSDPSVPQSVPWSKVQLKSTNSSVTAGFGRSLWSRSNLRSNPNSVKVAPPKMPSRTLSEEPTKVITQSTTTPIEENKTAEIPAGAATPPRTSAKKLHTTKSPVPTFVPLTSNGYDGPPWKAVKLRSKHANAAPQKDSDKDEIQPKAPWGTVRLRRIESPVAEPGRGNEDEEDGKDQEEENERDDTIESLPMGDLTIDVCDYSESPTDEDEPSIQPVSENNSESESLSELPDDTSDEENSSLKTNESNVVGRGQLLSELLSARAPPKEKTTVTMKPKVIERFRQHPQNKNETAKISDGRGKTLSEMLASRASKASEPSPRTANVNYSGTLSAESNSVFTGRGQILSPLLAARMPSKPTLSSVELPKKIDLTNIPVIIHKADEEAAIIALGNVNGVVILGNKVMATAKRIEGSDNALIDWHIEREKVLSLTLDMAHNRADLILCDGSAVPIVLDKAESCLQFAAAFYNMPAVVASEPNGDEPTIDTRRKSKAEQLNEEEQLVLRRYRQARMSKGADDAMRETIGSGIASMTEEEEKTANVYRKMLKMRIPIEAVQHKMTKDGVSKKIVDAVLNTSSTNKGKTSGLSEDDEKQVEVFRKMLKLKIPPEAVRHKMMKEGVSERVMNAVLNGSQNDKTSSNSLSDEEEKVAETFRKMLKMRIPPEAVRHKMTKENISQKIINVVMGNRDESPTHTQPESKTTKSPEKADTLSDEERKIVQTYRKMLKLMVPADAVKERMKKDQVSHKVVVALFPDEGKKSKNGTDLTEEELALASSYQKMLKMKIPTDAVKHKMTKEGVKEKIVLFVLGGEKESNLSPEEEAQAESYRKMLKMRIPEEAVRHKMTKEGASEAVILAVFGKAKNGGVGSTGHVSQRGKKLVSLHWTPLSGEELNNSVWRAKKKRKVSVGQPGTIDISKLVELFQKKSNPKAGATANAGSNKDGDKANLLDRNRAQNVAISLKGFKEFSHKELAEIISNLDPKQKIKGERVQFLKDLLPTIAEVKVIKAYNGDNNRLAPAELFFKQIVDIKRIEDKVEVMKTMNTLPENAKELIQSFHVMSNVCRQIQTSERLQELLEMVLHVGNIMNEGTRTGGAAGFKFDSLLKLTQTKSSDGKTTVLDYLVMIFVAKDKRETLEVVDDFPDCQEASRLLLPDLMGEVKTMSGALKKCRTELNQLIKESNKRNSPPVAASNPASNPKAALFAAITERKPDQSHTEEKKDDDPKPQVPKLKPVENRVIGGSSFLDVITSCTNPTIYDDEVDGMNDSTIAKKGDVMGGKSLELPLSDGISRLKDFVDMGGKVYEEVEKAQEEAVASCRELSRYCGETGGERSAAMLLSTLAQFATCLDEAVKKHDRKVELEQKKEAASKKRQDTKRRSMSIDEPKKSPECPVANAPQHQGPLTQNGGQDLINNTEKAEATKDAEFMTIDERIQQSRQAPNGKGGSLILMVNKMLQDASPRAKEDFSKGIVYNNADETLKKIYEKERECVKFRPIQTGKKSEHADIMSAIQARRQGPS